MQAGRAPPLNDDYINIGGQGGFGGIRRGFNNPSRLDNQSQTYTRLPPSHPTTPLDPYDIMVPGFVNGVNQIVPDMSSPENGGTQTNEDRTDEVMTAPAGFSRNPSMGQPVEEMGYPCSCPNALDSMASTANVFSRLGTYAGRSPLPGYALPGFNELLNHQPSSQVHPNQGRSHIAHRGQYYNQPPPDHQAPNASALTRSSLSNLSILSTISSNTIQAPLSIAERRSNLLVALYGICLQASAAYTRSFTWPVGRNRAQPPLGSRRPQGDRYHPYALARVSHCQSRSHRAHSGERALMDYISIISTHIWRKARSDLIAPHRAEAVAVREMRDLYTWGEFLVRGVEDEDHVYDEEQSDSSYGAWMEEESTMMVGKVATRLCRWLGEREALRACQRVSMELLGLMREQAEERRVSVGERPDEFGNNL
jgi:hypothetical protein